MTKFCRCCKKNNKFNNKWLYVLQQKEHIQWQTNIYSSILYSIFCRYDKRTYTPVFCTLYSVGAATKRTRSKTNEHIYSSIQYSIFCGCCKCNKTLHQLPLLCMTSIPNDQINEDFSLQTVTTEFFFYVALRPRKRGGFIRDGDRGGRGGKSEGSTAETARKRPERPWTAARTMEVLRRCPLAIAQRLVHRAIDVSTTVLGQSHKDNVRCTAVDEQLGQLKQRKFSFLSPAPPPYSWSLLG